MDESSSPATVENTRVTMQALVSLCKRRGFIFQSSEIYGGFGSTYDFGPLGVELRRNIKEAWWRDVVRSREEVVGIDAAILMHPKTWEASGHVTQFTDPMVDCKNCKSRFRADELTSDTCPVCGEKDQFTEARHFNLMFKTFVGPVEDKASVAYLRPETAQGIFVNFMNVLNTSRKKLPFGIAQIGKAFRNEITPGNFIFRTREFEQMELEYFVAPGTDEEWFQFWLDERYSWYQRYGIGEANLQLREHGKDELSHYSKRTVDIEYRFPFGWAELEGVANRTDFDLRQHAEFSGKELAFYDTESDEKVVPYIVEPSAGVDRAALAFLADGYHEEEVRGRKRVVMRLHPTLAPFQVAVLPLLRNRPELVDLAKEIAGRLRTRWAVDYDDRASIGRMYRRQDEIGTALAVTVDVESLEDRQVTVRDRDSMEQIRVPIPELEGAIAERLEAAAAGDT